MLGRRRSLLYRSSELNTYLRSRTFTKRDSVFGILAIIAILGWCYVVFMSSWLHISEVYAENLHQIDAVELKREVFAILDSDPRWRPWPKRHRWFIDKERLQIQLKERLFAQRVEVVNTSSAQLQLTIQERSKRIILHSRQWYGWVDLQGVVTTELTDNERRDAQSILLGQRAWNKGDAPIIKKNLDEAPNEGFVITTESEMKDWLYWHDQLISHGLSLRELVPPTASSTRLVALSGFDEEVIFDITTPLDLQVKTYNEFKKTTEGARKRYEYVDVRVPGRAYVKE